MKRLLAFAWLMYWYFWFPLRWRRAEHRVDWAFAAGQLQIMWQQSSYPLWNRHTARWWADEMGPF